MQSALGLKDVNPNSFVPEEWANAQASFPGPDAIPYLDPEFIKDAAAKAMLTDEDVEEAVAVAGQISGNEALARLSWHYHYLVFGPGTNPDRRSAAGGFPYLWSALGERGGYFYLLQLLAGVDQMLDHHARLGVPEWVSRDTLSDIPRKLAEHEQWFGRRGILPRSASFITIHLFGNLFQLGRLQFELRTFGYSVRVYRERRTKRVLALARPGVPLSADGRHILPPDAPGAWRAHFEETESAVEGHPVHPQGRVLGQRARLPKESWEPALMPGDPVLQLHIPSGEPLDPDRCLASFRAAEEFFPAYVPAHPFKAYALTTWFLDYQLEEHLPPSANTVQMMRQFYRVPSRSQPHAAFRFVFGPVERDLRELPQETSLQRLLVRHVQAGGTWHGGSGFIMRGEADWTARYLRSFSETHEMSL